MNRSTVRSRAHRSVAGVAALAVTAAITATTATTATAAPAAPVRAADLQTVAAPVTADLPDVQAKAVRQVAAAAVEPTYEVLVFSKTTGFRHGSIGAGIDAISELGDEYGFTVDATEDASLFTPENLAQYEAVIWLSTTSDVLNDTQQAAFEDYIQAGGGYVGIHAASDTEYTWPWYGDLVGAYFQSHPAGTPTATVNVENKETPSSCFLPTDWQRTDEWYNFQGTEDPVVNGGGLDYSPRDNPNINVIANLAESTYVENDGNATDDDHPTAWYQEFDGGRSFYTGGGHTDASFDEDLFRLHVLGGIQYAADQVEDACAAAPPTDADFEQVTLAKGVDKVGEPMSISVLPDGRVLHNARDGRVFLTDLDGNTTLVATVPVYQHDEDGLQSLTVDPNFAENGWVYLYYAPPLDTPAGDAPNEGTPEQLAVWDGYNVLTRVKMVDDELDFSTEQEMLQVAANRGICCHAGGAIDFDADGNLYLSTGDDSNPFASDGFAPLDERTTRNSAYDAQRSSANSNDLRGKVIRITPDPTEATYTIPEGNLFDEADDTEDLTRPEIYAMGFRNPFRMTVDKETGYVYLGEYGPDAGSANPNRGPGGIVEFNQIRAAGNFGWPYCTGPNTTATTYNAYDFGTLTSGAKFDCTAPVNNSPHNTGLTNLPPAQAAWIAYDGGSVTYNGQTTNEFGGGGEAPMAGPVYNYDPDLESDVKFPAYFDNHFFAGEWTRGWIRDIALDAEGDVSSIDPFFDSSTLYAAMDMEFGPDGSLYVLDYGNGGYFQGNENSAVYKINYINAGARSPNASASVTPNSGQAPLAVQFSSEGSSDPDGDAIESYSWDFENDGEIDSTEANPSHTYTETGVFDARLVVTDSTGRTGSATVVVTVGNTRPTVEIVMPPNGGFFEFGDSVQVEVVVTDPEDGEIDCSQVDIDYVLGHDSHGHPLSSTTGCDVTLPTVADEGHDASANIFGVISASYTDEGADGVAALSGQDEIVLQPKRKQAEHTTSAQGTATEATTDSQGGAQNLSNIDDGDFVTYSPVSLMGVDALRFRVASAGTGGTIEARLDGVDGELVGSVAVPVTGGWQTWQNVDMTVDPATQDGTHALYLVFKGVTPGATGLFNLNYFEARGRGVSVNSRPQVEVTATPDQGTAPLEVEFAGTATDADGDDLTYLWDFGVAGTDTDTATTLNGTYTYEQPGTYTARLTATDETGARGSATVVVRVVSACGGGTVVASDEFDGTSLDKCRWNSIVREDATRYEVADGELTINATGGDLYQTSDPSATTNLMLQADTNTSEDYVLETALSSTFTDGYGQAGLIAYSDDDNYVKLDVIADTGQGRISRVELRSELGATILEPQPQLDVPANVSTYRLRLTKSGTGYTGEIALDGGDWTTVGTVTNTTADMDFGLMAIGNTQPDRTSSFDYFRVAGEGSECGELTTPDDAFDGTELDTCRWNAIVAEDTELYSVADGSLNITTAPGEIYQGGTGKSNLILQSADHAGSDYVLETVVDVSNLDGAYSQAGIMVYGNDSNYVKLEPLSDDGQTFANRVELRSEVDDVITADIPEIALTEAEANAPLHLRLTKEGSSYSGEISTDGGASWRSMSTSVTNEMEAPSFGVFTAGVNQSGDVVSFDSFTVDGPDVVNTAPVAVDDTATTTAGTPVDVDVLANDTDADADTTLTVESVTEPASGTASVDEDGVVTYTPNDGFAGEDTFDYVVSDGVDTSIATVTVTVTDVPVVLADTRIIAAPSGVTRSTVATVRFEATGAGSAGATFECSLDGAPYRACVSPATFRGLRDGIHVVRVRAVTAAGADATPARARWTVDSTGPRIAATKPAGTTRDRTPTISAKVTDRLSAVRRGGITLVVDGKPVNFSLKNGKVAFTPKRPMSYGKHAVRLVAVDAAGNRTVQTWTFKVRR